jgi:hypothetical protein
MPGAGQQQPAQSNLPADVSKWKRDEYYQARRDGDPKLKDAVKYLGKSFSLRQTRDAKKSDQAATLLVRLLSGELPKAIAEAAGGQAGPAGSSSADSSSSYSADSSSSSSAGPTGPPEGMMGGPPDGMMGGPPAGMPGMPGGMYGSGGMGGAGQIKPLDAETMKAIVDALAVNGGSVAKKALADILAGTLKSDSDLVATRSALETLVKDSTPESEATLLKAVTSPDSIRPKPKAAAQQAGAGMPGSPYAPGSPAGMGPAGAMPADGAEGATSADAPAGGMPAGDPGAPDSSSSAGPGMGPMGPMGPGYPGGMMGGSQAKLGPAELQTLALAVATPVATEAFRVKVANALSGGSTAPEYRGPLAKFLLNPNPENLAAQFILLKGTTIDPAAKATIGSYLTTYSSQALCALLGIPTQSLKAHRVGGAGGMPGSGMPGPGMPGPYPGAESSSSADPSGVSAPPGMPGAPAGMPGEPMGPGMPGGPEMSAGYPGMPGGGYPGMPGGGYPGMPGAPGAGAAGRLSVIELAKQYAKDPDLAYRVGRQLWSDEFVAMSLARLEAVPSLRNGAPEILLAGTIPVDSVRAQLYEVLKKNHAEGPKALEAAGLGGAVITDPGLLAVIKALPRKDLEPEKVTAMQRYRREARERPGQGGGQGMPMQPGQDLKKAKGAAGKKAKAGKARADSGEAPDSAMSGAPMPGAPMYGADGTGSPMGGQQTGQGPEYQWMDASELLARAMCEWFAAAARKGLEVSEDSRPIEIPASANVVAEYHFDWPKSLANAGGLAGVSPDPMMVHYVRLEQKTAPRKVFAYFRQGARILRPEEHPVSNGFWMESLRPVPGTDRQRSVDVFVTKKEDPSKAKPSAVPGAYPGMPGAGGYPGMPGPGGPMAGSPDSSGPGPGGMQGRQREPLDKDEVGELVVEILAVEVKSPAPLADRTSTDDGKEEAATEKGKTSPKGKSKATTIE